MRLCEGGHGKKNNQKLKPLLARSSCSVAYPKIEQSAM